MVGMALEKNKRSEVEFLEFFFRMIFKFCMGSEQNRIDTTEYVVRLFIPFRDIRVEPLVR